jgi:hypothetical protein
MEETVSPASLLLAWLVGLFVFGVEAKLYMAYCTRTGWRYPFVVSVVEIQIQFGCFGLWSDRLETSYYLSRYRKLGLGILR